MMPGKLKDSAKCAVCKAEIIAVIRAWGPLTRFEYLHADPPFEVHITSMPLARAQEQQKKEEEVQLIQKPGNA
jgi:hypothetical protein